MEKTDPVPGVAPLATADAAFLLRALKGISTAHVRLHETDRDAGDAVLAFLHDHGIPATADVIERIEPPPLRRYSLRYSGAAAVLTVSAQRPLLG